MSEIHSTCPPEENEAHQSDSSSSYDDLSDSSSEIDTSDLDESAIEAKSTRQAEILAQMDNGETPTSPDPSEVSRDKTAEIVAQAMVDAGLADEQHYAMVGKSSQNLHLAEEIPAVQDRGADNLSCSMMSSPAESQFGAVVRRLTQSSVGQFFNQLTHAEGINQRRPKGDAFRQIDPGCFFDDGKRVIDYVLVYPLKRVRSKKAQQRDLELRKFRKAFEDKLIDIGLDVERVGVERSQDGKTCCVKLHATWDFMTRQAELMQLKAPIQRSNYRPEKPPWFSSLIRIFFKGKDPMEMSEEYEAEEYLHCGAKFDRRRMEMFSIRDERSFFTPIQRIRLVDSVVKQVSIGRTKRPKNSRKEENHSVPVNLHYLMNNKKAYSAAFPLHDSQFQYREEWRNPFRDVPAKCHPYRKWLFETWGSFKQFHKYQPIPQIRAYFGEEIGYYFALLGLYSKMLLYPAVLSFIFLLGSLAQVATDPVINDICHSPVYADKVFCPLCHGRIVQCPTTPVPAACLSMKISRTFDNDLTVAFAVFISIWAVFFQEFWKRRQNELAAIWDATEEESGDSALRPDFIQKAPKLHVNPLTQTEEPYFPAREKIKRSLVSLLILLFFAGVNFAFVAAVVIYRIASYSWFVVLKDPELALINMAITASMITAVGIAILELVYERVALALTRYECPSTDEEFQTSFVHKFLFLQFLNYYSQFFYIAVLKGQFAGPPHTQRRYADRCGPSGCLLELNIHLVVIMIGKQIAHSLLKFGYRRLSHYWRSRKTRKTKSSRAIPRYHQDFLLEEFPEFGLTANYVDLVLLYGFVVMFAAVYPIAALFAMIYTLFKIRLDANQILTNYRRPVPKRRNDIGCWMNILALLTRLSVITNAIIIAVTSEFVDRVVYVVYYSFDGTLIGYLDHIWTEFDSADYRDPKMKWLEQSNDTFRFCQYKDYRYNNNTETPYDREIEWWQVTAARLAFILLFEHFASFIQGLVANLVSDVPESVVLHRQRTQQLVKDHYSHSGGASKTDTSDIDKMADTYKPQESYVTEGGRRTEGGFWAKYYQQINDVTAQSENTARLKRPLLVRLLQKFHLFC